MHICADRKRDAGDSFWLRALPWFLVRTECCNSRKWPQTISNLEETHYQAPLRLQKLILRTKPYAVNVKCVPGSSFVSADTPCRVLPIETPHGPDEFEIHVLDSENFSEPICSRNWKMRQKDPELQQLKTVVMDGWPQIKDKTPAETRPYWNYRNEISCYEDWCSRVIE